jgi:hypothetical protein
MLLVWVVTHAHVRLLAAHPLSLTRAALCWLGVLAYGLGGNSLTARSLSATTLSVKDDLVSVVTVISSLKYLLLSLNLLVIWQLCRVIHIDFSSFIEVHVT